MRARKATPPVNTGQIQEGGRFKPGQSGNPSGKPRGARHRTTEMLEKILADGAEATVRATLDAAKDGDMTAARLVLDRVCPLRRGRPVELKLPGIDTAEDISAALSTVTQAMCAGEITPEEAAVIAGVIEVKRKAVEMGELEARIQALEARP